MSEAQTTQEGATEEAAPVSLVAFELKALEGSKFVEALDSGALVYAAIASTGKDAAKREERFLHTVWPTVAVALATIGEERLLDLATRQEKTDRMNQKRNEMNAQKSAATIMARVMKDVAEGRCTAEQAEAAFKAAMAQAAAEQVAAEQVAAVAVVTGEEEPSAA